MRCSKLVLLFSVLLSWQCTKQDQIWEETQTTIVSGAENAQFFIQAIDEEGALVAGAMLQENLAGQSWEAGEQEVIVIPGTDIPSGGLPVTLTANGYLPQVKTLAGSDNQAAYLQFRMARFRAESTAAAGALAGLDGGGQLRLPYSLVGPDGSPYTEEVKVQSRYYPPSSPATAEAAPGNLSAVGQDGKAYTIAPYGIYAITLLSADGQELQPGEGTTATLQFPIPDSYPSGAAGAPLLSMDEATGRWVEEGAAQMRNGYLEAEVGHFSWWASAQLYTPANLCLRLVGQNGLPLPYFNYRISSPEQDEFYASGWTDGSGQLCTWAPAGLPLAVGLYWEGSLLPPTALGSIDSDTELGDLPVGWGTLALVAGQGTDCDGSPAPSLMTAYTMNNTTGYTLANQEGNFRFLSAGQGLLEVQLTNYEANTQSEPRSILIDEQGAAYDLGAIMACEPNNGSGLVNVQGAINESMTWEGGNTYVLNGLVIVEEGASLTIEPGTVIKGAPGEGANASALVIAQGAQIIAEGTPNLPIVFTSLADEVTPQAIASGQYGSPNLSPDEHGLWGGVILMGRAPVSAVNEFGQDVNEAKISSLLIPELFSQYGGLNPDDSSGRLSHLSIRHAGVSLGLGYDVQGLVLAGIGRETSIEHIEIVGAKDDAIALFGGTVTLSDIVAWNAEDDGIDTDQGWSGTLGNFVVLTPGSSALELDGPEGSLPGSHRIQNGTIVMNGNGRTAQQYLIDVDEDTGCELSSLHFIGPFAQGQTVTNHEIGPGATFEDITFDIAPAEFSSLFNNSAPIPAGCSPGGSPQADVTVFNWTWAAESGNLDGL
ncbi:hypothetical protein [Phaeodactylibacter luteus]|uniref:Carboxypeptidase regulatory-like domain-containing protein n=1 Tax=Phaeodactylibacter luteus TaxID=1564516 RepID=A0A5C6S5N9_9BACT|nr:hypothetical protein [Phaeodactylibacter luteus]TXB70138.1 hypothetical protein FRY97_00090 [Phaeodactylibacter luteus]